LSNFSTFEYNLKGGLRFSTFIFWVSPKLAKHIYGWLLVEQHHKIEKTKSLIPILPTNKLWHNLNIQKFSLYNLLLWILKSWPKISLISYLSM
jgi:hypothetical protein